LKSKKILNKNHYRKIDRWLLAAGVVLVLSMKPVAVHAQMPFNSMDAQSNAIIGTVGPGIASAQTSKPSLAEMQKRQTYVSDDYRFRSVSDSLAEQREVPALINRRRSALTQAVVSQEPKRFQEAIAQLTDPNGLDVNRQTALISAIKLRNLASVQTLLRIGADPNVKGPGARLPLQEAVLQRDSQVIAALIRGGANPNFIGASHQTPIMTASEMGYLPALEQLFQSGANINFHLDQQRLPLEPGLVACARAQQEAACRRLLQLGADPNLADPQGRTALFYACLHRMAPLVRSLLAAGAMAGTIGVDWAFE
jgi:ankyrin repeat protein